MDHMINDDEGLLINSTSSNKRSLTTHFVDYMRKTKCLVPCSLFPAHKIAEESVKKQTADIHGKRGNDRKRQDLFRFVYISRH